MKTRVIVLLRQALFLLILTPVAVSAQKPNSKDKQTAAQLKTDISYLASDALGGRLTGSSGQDAAAEYIIKAFEAAKLQPMGENGQWIQNFQISQARLANSGCVLNIDNKIFRVFEDFYPISYCVDQGSANGPLFNAGKGITAPELNYNDYANASGIQGKIFIIDIASPDSNSAHGKFAQFDLHYRIETAIKNGASAVLLVNSDSTTADPDASLEPRIKPLEKPVFFVKKYTADSLMKLGKGALVRADLLTIKANGKNVIGFYDNKAATTVVIGAHYDHLGTGEMGGSRTKETGLIHNGADDNASGTAALMELARRITADKSLSHHNYLFIAFSGEEEGLLGSNHFTKNPTYALDKVAYMINMDMVGRLDSTTHILMVNGVGTSPAWKPAMELLVGKDSVIAKQAGLRIKTSEGGMGSSDHTSFYLSNIPALHFFTGQHYDYHMPTDDAERINYEGEVKVINYIQALLQKLDNQEKPAFTKTKDEETSRTSFKVTLGIMPDYVYSDDGVRVDGVTDGKPASKAGIQRGDIILQLGDIPVHTMQDYMKALGAFNKGESTKVKIKRGTETQELTVQF